MRVLGNITCQLKCYTIAHVSAAAHGSVRAAVYLLSFKDLSLATVSARLQCTGNFDNADRYGAGRGRLLNRRAR
jgi:hypothetical protein